MMEFPFLDIKFLKKENFDDLFMAVCMKVDAAGFSCQGHSNPKLPVPEEGTELDSNGRTYTTGRPTNTA